MRRKVIIAFVLIFQGLTLFAQARTVSGVLSDDSGPLPGVSILIKGTSRGTETDFDGKYSIECNVGDVLVFSFVGMKTREVVVTNKMFTDANTNNAKYIEVKLLRSNAYEEAIKKNKKEQKILNIDNAKRVYNGNKVYTEFYRIKDIVIGEENVKLTYFKPDIYFEINLDTKIGFQFTKDSNLPELQCSFSQGASSLGQLSFQGPTTGNLFSYGPNLNALEFNGIANPYDINGELVGLGLGNGNTAKAYDNLLFQDVVNHAHNLSLNVATKNERFDVYVDNENTKDQYGKEQSVSNKLRLSYQQFKDLNRLNWESFITYQDLENNQPNINGFQNNLLLNLWATPPSFSNNQGAILPDNTQRSFSVSFNNPNWLLDQNKNTIENEIFSLSVKNKIDLANFKLKGALNFNHQTNNQEFGLPRGSVGFEEGFLTKKQVKENSITARLNLAYKKDYTHDELNIKSIVNYDYETLDFLFSESIGFQPFSFDNASNNIENNVVKSRTRLQLSNQFKYDLDNKFKFTLINNSYISSIQKNEWFLPSFELEADLKTVFDMYAFNRLVLTSKASFNVNDMPLYYRNQSHNSLLISPEQSLGYTTNNDLFINSNIALEKIKSYEVNGFLSFYMLEGNTDINLTYYHRKIEGSVFPVLESGNFRLSNVADIINTGFEIELNSSIRLFDDFFYNPSIVFTSYTNEVVALASNQRSIPIAGFNTTAKHLIEGKPSGVLVGSAYERDANNNIIIDSNGFPLVASAPEIIGNPIPDFNLGITNSFKWEGFKFSMTLDIQQGGDVWNGTQNVLNYLGTSLASGNDRTINNFVFSGMDVQGNTNTIPVDFYNPNNPIFENRFVRYGFEGLAEEAIVDASYINLKSIRASYAFLDDENDRFFRALELGVYANNIATWTKAKGYSPYDTLYGNASSQGLNFFNTPLLSEVGVTLKIKI